MARGEIKKNGTHSVLEVQGAGQQAEDPIVVSGLPGSSKRRLDGGDTAPPQKRMKGAKGIRSRLPNDAQKRRQGVATKHSGAANKAIADRTPAQRGGRPRTGRHNTTLPAQQSGQGGQAQHTDSPASPDLSRTDAEVARSWRKRMSGYYGLP